MGLDRRTFLQQAALALVSWGVSETGINLLSKNSRFAGWLKPYVETLAQTTTRKLALLVGINQYSEKAHLSGCLNDVELQKELLVSRFGFKPQNIYTLTDRQATRENIETAFTEYLTEQANSNDIVLFHFSGYGSQVQVPNPLDNTQLKLVNSLVPIDATIPNKGNPATNDLLQSTINELARSLKTDNLITVLDTSFKNTQETLQGNYRVRSFSQVAQRPSPEELAFRSQIQISTVSQGNRKTGIIPGILLSAAEQNQVALEGTWNNFSAGLLTYALTRYLWQTMPKTNFPVAFQQTTTNVSSWSEKQQQPKITGKLKSNLMVNSTVQPSGGEGFIAGIDNKGMFNLQLTALSPVLLDAYKEESCFVVADSPEANLLQLRSLDGITGKAQPIGTIGSVKPNSLTNQLIQEKIRVLPRNLGLSVALDNHLERIEKVDATSALANIATVKATPNAGEAYADCLLGKISVMVDKKTVNNPQATENPSHSYGLYTPRGQLIPNTPGETNEVVKLAISRLEADLGRLLAAKWLELTVNENSTTIPVAVSLELVSKNSTPIKQTSLRVLSNPEFNQNLPRIERNAEVRLKIDNKSDRDLYGMIVGIDNETKFITLYPLQKLSTKESSVVSEQLKIPAKNQLTIPQSSNTGKWKISQPLGINHLYLLLTIKPFKNALSLITQQPPTKLDELQFVNLPKPLTVATAILQDLHSSSNVSTEILSNNTDNYALDVNSWVGFKLTYEVV